MDAAEQEFILHITQARYLTAAGVLALLWTIESFAPLFPGRRRRLSHNASNLALAALNAIVAFTFAFAILSLTELARAHSFGLVRLVPLPVWLQWIAALVLLDCWQYWWHRLNHRVPLLWRFHAMHHADAEMDASSGVRFHTVEIVLSFSARLVVLPLIGLTLPQLLVYEAIALPIILFHHSNIRIFPPLDRALRLLIVTPHMHVVHHSRLRPETDSNYSSVLSLWDRLFRSFRLRKHPREIEIGLDDWSEPDWRPLPRMLLTPFRTKSRPRRKRRGER